MAINFALSDAAQAVLASLKTQPYMCMHQLHESSKVPYTVLRRLVQALHREGKIVRVDGANTHDKVYQLANLDDVPIEKAPPSVPWFFGLDEGTVRDRVVMLERMKARLIVQWHPILDKVIGDYKQGLKYAENLRGEDIDDF